MPAKKAKEEKKDATILKEIKDRFDEAQKADDDLYNVCIDDLEFMEGGSQWPSDVKKDRDADGRPCLEINKVAVFCDQVIGDIRQNAPSIKVKPVDSEADPDTAEVITGLIRNIEVQSAADIAYDTASESSVECGVGAFRIVTEYSDDKTFDQDIRIKRIKNPFTIHWDPSSVEWDRRDARYCFLSERVARDEFERQYPDAAVQDFKASKKDGGTWMDEKFIRVAEYWRKKVEKRKLYLQKDPITGAEMIGNDKLDGWDVVQERDIEDHKVEWYKTNGVEILEGPTAWPSRYIPIVMTYGKELNIEGRSIYRGVIRHAKDPQRLYNYSRSHNAEVTALAPKAPYLVTAKMINNYQGIWDKAHKKNFPYLPYEPDQLAAGAGGMPKRESPVVQNTGILAEIQIADQEMHDTTGLQQASLGKKSNEKSGKAIMARQREGDVANFSYYDNLARSLKYAGLCIVDLLPRIYDTARVVRILGEDNAEKMVKINQQTEDESGESVLYDLTVGKYDVVVSIGPSYTTQREEAADGMLALMGVLPPQANMMIADLVISNFDWPGADKIADRLRKLLPPGIAEEDGQGPPPPQPPPPPDPLAQLEAQSKQADLEGKLIDNRAKRVQQAQAELGTMMAGGGMGPQQ